MPRQGYREFKTDPLRELGIDAGESQSIATQIALAAPATYFGLRQAVLKSVVSSNVDDIYNCVWQCLTQGRGTVINAQGQRAANQPIIVLPAEVQQYNGGRPNWEPKLPESEVNAIALSIARGFKDLVEQHLVNRIMPQNLHELAVQKTVARTRADVATGNVN